MKSAFAHQESLARIGQISDEARESRCVGQLWSEQGSSCSLSFSI